MSWPHAALGDVAEFINGFAFKPADWGPEGRPIIRIQNLTKSSNVLNRTTKRVPEKYHVSAGELLVSWSASLGVFEHEGEDALVNQHIFRVRENPSRIVRSYLRHMIDCSIVSMENIAHGSTMKHINRREFLGHEIPLPPLEEQRRIAGILDAADALRRRRREALALLDTLPAAIFAEMFGDDPDTAGDWPMKEFGDLVSDSIIGLVRGAMEISTDLPVPYLKMDSITRSGRINLDKLVGIEASSSEIAKYSVAQGDLLFNTRNTKELVGKSAVYYGPEGVVINNNVMRIRTTRQTSPDFISGYLRSPFGYRQLEQRKSGTTSVFAVYAKSLMTLPVPVPPRELVEEYDGRCGRLRAVRDQHVAHLSEIETLFASLQSRAFAGAL